MLSVKFQNFICIAYDDFWQPENKNPLQKPVFLPCFLQKYGTFCAVEGCSLLYWMAAEKLKLTFEKEPKLNNVMIIIVH